MKRITAGFMGAISIILSLGGCASQENVYYIDAGISPVYEDRDAIVTIVSDDGFYETGVHLNELATKYNLRVTVAGVVEIVNPHLEEWKKIEEDGHVELISHSYSHLKMQAGQEFSEEELQHEITDSIMWYKDNFQTDQIAFVPPENTMCDRGYEILKENNIYAVRQGIREENSLMPLNGNWPSEWYRLYTSGIADLETTEWRNSVVDSTIKDKTWLIEMWHDVYEDGEEGETRYQAISVNQADEHMSYLRQKQDDGSIWVASFVDATKYIYERKYCKVEVFYTHKEMNIKVSLDEENLPTEIFDVPVTVKIPVPESWYDSNIDMTEGISVKEENNIKYILVTIKPNEQIVIQK